MAPGPLPTMVADVGYAIPVRKINSSGSASGANETTWFQTTLTGASIVMLVVTAKTGGSSLAACSANISTGSMNIQLANVGADGLRRQLSICDARSAPPIANGTESGNAINRQM